jgi:hypothetical protein
MVEKSPLSRRSMLAWGSVAVAGAGVGAVALWPSRTERAAYPLAGRLAGAVEPLWNVAPEILGRATQADAERLEQLLGALERGIAGIEELDARLTHAQTGDLSGADRQRLREQWWQFFEPILAIDELKTRYKAWYGLDYLKQARLHARAFALSFAGLCAQVDAGLRLLATLDGKPLLPVLFDEAMPDLGLPARTLSGVRKNLGRARDLFYVPFGDDWYSRWILPELRADTALGAFVSDLDRLRQRARARVLTSTSTGITNKADTLKNEAFESWFPLQKNFAEWAGDTRLARESRRLIDDEKLATFHAQLEPGDIIVERRNWYLSNIGLPGFWPHAELYLGTQAQILSALGNVPEVRTAFGSLGEHFEGASPAAWASLATSDRDGHALCIIEAVSEGVVTSSLEHACGADYVAALRPRVGPLTRVRAIERALRFWGRPYDFNFDFATDDELVCSELVVKAYEPDAGQEGINIPYVDIIGRRAVPPTEIVRAFRDERGKPNRQLDFVYFLDGRESEHGAIVADADALAATCDRPKWDIVQP